MVELIGVIVLTLAGAATLVALLTTLTFLIPSCAHQAHQTLQTTPGRAFIIGLANLIFFGLLAAFLSNGGELMGLIGLLILLALLGLAMVGLTGLLLVLRQRVYPSDDDVYGLQVTVKTAVLLIMAFLAPVVGWFILLPITLVTALGAGVITLARRLRTPRPSTFETPA